MVTTGLVPPEVLQVLQAEVPKSFDCNIDWYPAGIADVHADRPYPLVPIVLRGRIVEAYHTYYDADGQHRVPIRNYYLPLGTAVSPKDKLLPSGDNPSRWPPIEEIRRIPTTGEPVMLRVRTGRA